MTKSELIKRYTLFIISLFFSALGVAFTKHGELVVSPTSSIANVISCKYTALSLGTLLIIQNCLRGNFRASVPGILPVQDRGNQRGNHHFCALYRHGR